MTPKEALKRFNDFVVSSKINQVNTFVFYGYEIEELQKVLKEHKRLQKFKETFDNYELAKKQEFIAYENWLECEKELEALKKPPTVEEVCMELSRHYKEQVSYSNERHNHMFYFEKSRLGIVVLLFENINFIRGDYHKTNDLPPHLITLIGRFYQSLEVK